MSLQLRAHVWACGLAVSPAGLPVTDGNELRVRRGWQRLNIFIFMCVCLRVCLVALLSLWASGGVADLWKEDAFPKWGHFGWFGFKKQINSVQRPRRIKAKKDVYVCKSVYPCVNCHFFFSCIIMNVCILLCSTLICSMTVNMPCICVLLPAPDRHARMQSDSKTSATRLPGRLHQRQQRR